MDGLFIDLYQSGEIASARSEAARANDKVSNLLDELNRVSRRLDRMALLNAALWELAKDKLGLADADLKALAVELDAKDGKIDGRLGATLRKCVKCGKTLMSKQTKCQYCGTDNAAADPFAAV